MIQDTLFMVLGVTSCPNTDKVGQSKVLYCKRSSLSPREIIYTADTPPVCLTFFFGAFQLKKAPVKV